MNEKKTYTAEDNIKGTYFSVRQMEKDIGELVLLMKQILTVVEKMSGDRSDREACADKSDLPF